MESYGIKGREGLEKVIHKSPGREDTRTINGKLRDTCLRENRQKDCELEVHDKKRKRELWR